MLIKEQKLDLVYEKCYCIFLTHESEVAQTSQVEKFNSHYMQAYAYERPSFHPLPLLWKDCFF